MPSLTSIQNAIDKASTKYSVQDRTIYKRVTTIASTNPLLVEYQSVDSTDVLLIPQPFYSRPEKLDIGSLREPTDVLSPDGTSAIPNTEYVLFFSTNCLSLSDIQNPTLTIVFKDSQGNEEEFRITDYEPVPFQGGDAAITAYIKSFKKQGGVLDNNISNSGG